jgi:calcium-dependent protein kinase
MTEPFGSPIYMAPEVVKGLYNYKCDIWSVGVILHTLVINVPPFYANDDRQILKMIVESTQINFEDKLWKTRSIGCIALVKLMLDINFHVRITAEAAQEHFWLQSFSHFNIEKSSIIECLKNFKQFRSVGAL